jgi:hypothetical protein
MAKLFKAKTFNNLMKDVEKSFGFAEKSGSKTKEEKREYALAYGTEVKYVNCPLCGMNKPKNRYDTGSAKFDSIDLERMHIITIRKGGGRGYGFHKVPEESLLLKEITDDAEYAEIIRQIKEQCFKILSVLGEV